MYIRDAVIVIVVFDLSKEETFKSIPRWISDVKSNCNNIPRIYLCGNKSDLKQQVSDDDIRKLCDEQEIPFYATSALQGSGIDRMFEQIVKDLPTYTGTAEDDVKLRPNQDQKRGCC